MNIERAKGNVTSKLRNIKFNLDVLEDYKRIIMKFNKLHSFLFVALLPIAFSLIIPAWTMPTGEELSLDVLKKQGCITLKSFKKVSKEDGADIIFDGHTYIICGRKHFTGWLRFSKNSKSASFNITQLTLNEDYLGDYEGKSWNVFKRIADNFQRSMLGKFKVKIDSDKKETIKFYKKIGFKPSEDKKDNSVVLRYKNQETRDRKRKRDFVKSQHENRESKRKRSE